MNELQKQAHKQGCIRAGEIRRRKKENAFPRREGESKASHVLRTITAMEKEKLIIRLSNSSKQSSGCVLWIGRRGKYGYGSLSFRSIEIQAHRASFVCKKGTIPHGQFVCHTCDNALCINPEHLFLGTSFDNMQDMCRKGRHWMQKKVTEYCLRGHEYTPENTLLNRKGKCCRACRNSRRTIRRAQLKAQGKNPYNA